MDALPSPSVGASCGRLSSQGGCCKCLLAVRKLVPGSGERSAARMGLYMFSRHSFESEAHQKDSMNLRVHSTRSEGDILSLVRLCMRLTHGCSSRGGTGGQDKSVDGAVVSVTVEGAASWAESEAQV